MVQLLEEVEKAADRVDVRAAVGRVYGDLQQEIDRRRPICTASGRCCRFEAYGHRLFVTTMELATFMHELDRLSQTLKGPLPHGRGSLSSHDASRKTRRASSEPAPRDVERQLPVLTTAEDGRVIQSADGCPFQTGRLCGVHSIRPFGCRIFFCDASAGAWQNRQYERFHAELKRLHESLGVAYFYVEWRQGLAALGLGPVVTRGTGF